jgi:transposase
MAPRLAASQHVLIHDMIVSGDLSARDMADVAGCSIRLIKHIRCNIRCFGTTKAPYNGVGRPRSVTPLMIQVLQEHLIEKPGLYLDETALFLRDEFEVILTAMSISRALKSIRWSKNVARNIVKELSTDLRHYYLYNLSAFRSYHLVYVDESGCD